MCALTTKLLTKIPNPTLVILATQPKEIHPTLTQSPTQPFPGRNLEIWRSSTNKSSDQRRHFAQLPRKSFFSARLSFPCEYLHIHNWISESGRKPKTIKMPESGHRREYILRFFIIVIITLHSSLAGDCMSSGVWLGWKGILRTGSFLKTMLPFHLVVSLPNTMPLLPLDGY